MPSFIPTDSAPLTELIPVADTPGHNCLPLPKYITNTVSDFKILRAQRYSMGDSLLACMMMICSNGPSLDQKEVVEKLLIAVVARFKAFKKRVPSMSSAGKRSQGASASKAKSSVMSELSGEC
jgi:hypothetical protein